MAYTMYTPLNVWLDPASVTDVVAYIQNYLSENTIYSEEEIETLIHDYLEAHPELIGGVQSVNGKTGTVVLTASDINTSDSTTIQAVLNSLSADIAAIVQSVTNEVTARSNADTELIGRITTNATGITNEATARANADTALGNRITALQGAVGSPLVASTASAMTDTSKIYVYTGSETGYTNGNWYYYNGSAWASGGVYNATAINTDTTLTVAGMAADAKATGDGLNDLKSKIDVVIDSNIIADISYETITATGAYAYKEIEYNAIPGTYYGTIQSASGGTPGNFLAYLAAYDSSGTRILQTAFDTTYPSHATLVAPSGTVKIKIRLFATLGTSETVTVTYSGIKVLFDNETEQYTIKDVPELENAVFGRNATGTKTFTGTGETNLDIDFSINPNDVICLKLVNTDIVGDMQLYTYDGSYTNIKYISLLTENLIKFKATTSAYRVRLHYIINSVGSSPSSVVDVYTQPLFSSVDDHIIHVGKGYDFTDIQSAINSAEDSADNPIIIFVHNGEYRRFSTYYSVTRVRYISIIGESRTGVIVRDNTGVYSKPTASTCINGVVKNITFIQETDADHYEGPGSQPYCYALHDDYHGCNTDYENCTFISNAGPAVGIGLKANKTKSFRNCTFINNGDGAYGSTSIGAFFAHSETAEASYNQGLDIENCTAINVSGVNGYYIVVISGYEDGTYNASIRNSGSFGNGSASAQCTIDLSYSYNNNVNALNVI